MICLLPQPSVVDVSGTDSYLAGPGIKIKNRRIIHMYCLNTATARVCVLTARPAGLLYARRAALRYSYARPRDNIYIALRICIRGRSSVHVTIHNVYVQLSICGIYSSYIDRDYCPCWRIRQALYRGCVHTQSTRHDCSLRAGCFDVFRHW